MFNTFNDNSCQSVTRLQLYILTSTVIDVSPFQFQY